MRWTQIAIFALLSSSSALAQTTCNDGVRIQFYGAWPPSQRATVLGQLELSLGSRGLQICDPPEPAVLATITFRRRDARTAQLTIIVRDEVTSKRVERDMQLDGFSELSAGLALAISADELLVASWAELALLRRQSEISSAPPVVVETVEREVRGQDPKAGWIGVGAGTLVATGGFLWVNANTGLEIQWRRRFATGFAIGGSFERQSHEEGTLRAGLGYAEIQAIVDLHIGSYGRLGSLLVLGGGAARVQGRASRPDRRGTRSLHAVGWVVAGLRATWEGTRFRLEGRALFGTPWLGFEVAGAEEVLGSFSGLLLAAELRLGVRFR